MINKKRGLLLASFLISVFIIAGVFAETCEIIDAADCSTENTVLKLYRENNTHAEIYSNSNYTWALCCDSFNPTHENTGQNKILSLSSSSNAHAGGPYESYGSVGVYFGDYNCDLFENTCDEQYPIKLLSLSSPTNAHLGSFDYYPYKLCCKQQTPTTNLLWKNENNSVILTTSYNPLSKELEYTVKIVIQNAGDLLDEKSIEIREADGSFFGSTSDSIKFLTALTRSYAEQTITAYWTIDEAAKIASGEEDDGIYEFYYEIGGEKSPILYFKENKSEFDVGEGNCGNGIQDGNETGIDCGGDCDPCVELYWSNPGKESPINTSKIQSRDLPDLPFKIQLNSRNANEGVFYLYENDSVGVQFVKSAEGVYEGENFYSIIELTLEDFNNSANEDDGEDNIYEFYFKLEGNDYVSSQILQIELEENLPICGNDDCETGENQNSCPEDCGDACYGLNICSDYLSSATCDADVCTVASTSESKCEWDASSEKCQEVVVASYNGIDIGKCKQINIENDDDCEDGFLTYSWEVNWTWAAENNYDNSVDCPEEGECIFLDGYYHYDPIGAYESCEGGTKTVACPAQIQLSYFVWQNFLIAAGIIFIIYFVILKRKKILKKKPKITKKKTSKKK